MKGEADDVRSGIWEKLNELLYGDERDLEERYKRIYGEEGYRQRLIEERKKLKRYYRMAVLGSVVLMALSLWMQMERDKSVATGEDGRITYIERPETGESPLTVDARVYAIDDQGGVSTEESIILEPRGKRGSDISVEDTQGMDREALLRQKISTAVMGLNEDRSDKKVKLPEKLEDGTRLVWEKKAGFDGEVILLALILIMLIIYSGRRGGIKKEEEMARESIVRGLPVFTNKMVLMLNAGAVVSSAFDRIMKDHESVRPQGERDEKGSGIRDDHFYEQLYGIYVRAKETNEPVHVQLKEFGKRSGVRELIRIADIIDDNINKGSDLVTKLQRETEGLWFVRKKLAEEKGKKAETKLTGPLMILLLVLVMITVAPAMLEI